MVVSTVAVLMGVGAVCLQTTCGVTRATLITRLTVLLQLVSFPFDHLSHLGNFLFSPVGPFSPLCSIFPKEKSTGPKLLHYGGYISLACMSGNGKQSPV